LSKKLKQKIKRTVLRLGYPLAKIFWFIFRPSHRGAKVILNYKNSILLICHSFGPYYWTLPGGGIKKGEKPDVAAIREVKEELDIVITTPIFLGTVSLLTDYKNDTVFVFSSTLPTEDFRIDEVELVEAKWFSLNKLPKLGRNAQKMLDLYLYGGK
jgi:8-oxo-dGTP pyrophosphatase MutT (NUDIX family)